MTPQHVVESGNKTTTTVKANVAGALLRALSTQCKAYCILSGYDRLPDDFDTDIDFMVDQEDFDRMPRIIEHLARQTGMHLFQANDHEPTARAYFLASISGPSITIVQLDCAGDYRHFGRRWLPAREVLAARRLHPQGFWIPSTAHEFAYSLIKRLNQRDFNRDHGYRLHRLYVEDRIECGRMIARFCRGPEGSAIVRMASANDWTQLRASPAAFRAAILRSRNETVAQKLESFAQHALHFFKRVVQPTGCWIAFIGPDGCGKSSVLSAVAPEFAPAFRSVVPYHLRPRVVGRKPAHQGPVTDPHGQPPRHLILSIAKIIALWLDYLLGYATQILPGVIRSRLILFDRCLYDLLVDSKSFRYGGPPWLLHAAARLSPRPDLVVLLDAPPAVLRSRRQEVPLEEVTRQRAAYLELARSLPSPKVINAAQPRENVIHDVIEAIVEHLAARTQRRLRLPESHGRTSPPGAAASSRPW